MRLALTADLKTPPGRQLERALAVQLGNLDPEVIARCVLQAALHGIIRRSKIAAAARRTGDALRRECWVRGLLEDRPIIASRKAAATKAAMSGKRRHRGHLAYKQREWTDEELIKAGAWGLDLLAVALPEVFCWRRTGKQNKGELFLDVRPKAMPVVEALVAEVVDYKPQTTPPLDWSGPYTGGPTDKRLWKTPLIRAQHKEIQKAAQAAIRSGTMKPVLHAVNTLQRVPWTINSRVLDVLVQCFERNMPVLFKQPESPVPPQPDQFDTDEEWDEEYHEADSAQQDGRKRRAVGLRCGTTSRRRRRLVTNASGCR